MYPRDGEKIMTEPYDRTIDRGSRDRLDEALDLTEQNADQWAAGSSGHYESSPILSGGDVDAGWDDEAVGEESVGGGNPTPDQSVVEDLGRAMGLTYQDDEPLHSEEKLLERDNHRWELDPASAEDFRK